MSANPSTAADPAHPVCCTTRVREPPTFVRDRAY